jgi:hypothetical protein
LRYIQAFEFCARNVTNSDWVCQDCAMVCLGRAWQDAASD